MVPPRTPSRLQDVPVDIHDDNSHAVIYRYKKAKESDAITPRVDVLKFFYPGKFPELQQRRDVFLFALAAMQELPATDKWSYYQIASIHGLPHQPYDPDSSKQSEVDWQHGYCQHGTPLFPTWHRPYTMLFEQSIIRQALLWAEGLRNEDEKKQAKEIAQNLRLPFWDWANRYTLMVGVPDVFTSTQISLAYKWQSFKRTRIPNPLKSFVLPMDLGKSFASSDVFNPEARPHYVVPAEGTPFTPKGYATVRHVSGNYQSQPDKLNLQIMRTAGTNLRAGVCAMFRHPDWLTFSNHFSDNRERKPGERKFYGHCSSLEVVHDMVHDTVGGGGQMEYPDIAAFDPIFFFHHCNVDRLAALWQYCYPESWIDDEKQNEQGSYSGSDNLTPYRRSQADAAFVSSNDVRTVDTDCGYTYPEIIHARENKWSSQTMLHYLLREYRPDWHFFYSWSMVLKKIPKRQFNGSYSIRVFIDKDDATFNTPLTDPHYAGVISIFARSSACLNCDKHEHLQGSLDLTPTMVRLGITTAAELNADTPFEKGAAPNCPLYEKSIKLVLASAGGEDFAHELDPADLGDEFEIEIYWQAGIKDEMSVEEEVKQWIDILKDKKLVTTRTAKPDQVKNAIPPIQDEGKVEFERKSAALFSVPPPPDFQVKIKPPDPDLACF